MNLKRTTRFILATEAVLVLPLIATLFTEEIDWDVADFVIASILLAVFGYALSLIINKSNNVIRIIIGLLIAAIIVLIWAELAVGIFNTSFAGS